MADVEDCRTIEIRTVLDHRGSICFVEAQQDIDFEIRRVYLTFDIPARATRAGHAHRELKELYIAASGSFDVLLKDTVRTRRLTLNRPNEALLVPSGIWRELENFSKNACLVVLASELFDEADYIREWPDYMDYVGRAER
jgi:dTDP-4-dehydrorhamnose 3,5-epimerase-like enzyme